MGMQWSSLSASERVVLRGIGGEQGIFIRPSMVRAMGGDGSATILLQQLLWWSQSDMAEERDGWFFITSQRLQKETGLSYDVQLRVRTKLEKLEVLETKRIGVPAKNYYRINLSKVIELLEEDEKRSENKILAKPSASNGHRQDQEDGNAKNYIVNNRVNNKENTILAPTDAKPNILGDKFENFVQWVMKVYPVNGVGISVTEGQARKAAMKIGGYLRTSRQEFIDRKHQELQTFITGMKNLKDATDDPSFDHKYVPSFANFSGIGIMYGKEPGYIAWSTRKKPEAPKRSLVV